MGGCGRHLSGEQYEVWDGRIDGSGCCEAPNRDDCCHTITDDIWRDYADSRYRPRTITDAAREFSTSKESTEARFIETPVTQSHSIFLARRSGQFVADWECEGCWTRQRWPPHITSLANYHIEIRFGRRQGDGSGVTGGIDSQIVNIDDIALVKVFCVPTLLRVSYFWISVTKLWDMIIRQCVCKGRTGHPNVLDGNSSWSSTNEWYIILPVTVKLETKTWIWDELYEESLSQ